MASPLTFVNPPCPAAELPPTPRGAHYHQCRCGSYLTCFSLPDQCGVGAGPWSCPSCEMKALDAHFDALTKRGVPVQGCIHCRPDRVCEYHRASNNPKNPPAPFNPRRVR